MSDFAELYRRLKPSVVAIAAKVSSNPEFPDIIGTGFIARPEGTVVTNQHVIEALSRLPRVKGMLADEWPAFVIYFHWVPGSGMAPLLLQIAGVTRAKREGPVKGVSYGPEIPDVGFIQVKMRGLPALTIEKEVNPNEGDEIRIAGFPMGTDTLRAPGWVHQLTPILQSGIISAVLPFPCDNPHAVVLDVMTQGGSSGSPVISPNTGNVIGLEYAGIIEPKTISGKAGVLGYENNTSLTLAIPSRVVNQLLEKYEAGNPEVMARRKEYEYLKDYLANNEMKTLEQKKPNPSMKPLYPQDFNKA